MEVYQQYRIRYAVVNSGASSHFYQLIILENSMPKYTFYDGHKYIYMMHDSIINYINIKGLKSRKAPALLRGFEEI